MSDEIKYTLTISVENGLFKEKVSPGQIDVDQETVGRGGFVQEFSTTEEDVDYGDVGAGTATDEGWCRMRNLDTTNYFDWGPQVGTGDAELCGRIYPGELVWFRLRPGAQLRGKCVQVGSGGITCKVDVGVYHN